MTGQSSRLVTACHGCYGESVSTWQDERREEDDYFQRLEKKEAVEERLRELKELKVRVVQCREVSLQGGACNYRYPPPLSLPPPPPPSPSSLSLYLPSPPPLSPPVCLHSRTPGGAVQKREPPSCVAESYQAMLPVRWLSELSLHLQ